MKRLQSLRVMIGTAEKHEDGKVTPHRLSAMEIVFRDPIIANPKAKNYEAAISCIFPIEDNGITAEEVAQTFDALAARIRDEIVDEKLKLEIVGT